MVVPHIILRVSYRLRSDYAISREGGEYNWVNNECEAIESLTEKYIPRMHC